MNQNPQQNDQIIMRQVLSLPVVMAVLLLITGGIGIYVNERSISNLFRLHDSALEPTIAFDEIMDNLNSLRQEILLANDSKSSPETKALSLKHASTRLQKISIQAESRINDSKERVFNTYLLAWDKDWESFRKELEPDLVSKNLALTITKHTIKVSDLIDKMGNIRSFVQLDIKEMLQQSRSFSRLASMTLYFNLIIGLAIGIFSSLFVIRNIKRLFRKIAESEAKLIHSAKLASLGEMAGGVAHEINNPLGIISILASQIQDLYEEEPLNIALIKEMNTKIILTTNRITKIVHGLRTFSRDGKNDSFQQVDVRLIIDETLALCYERFKNAGTNLVIEELTPDLAVNGRATEISQVILNLLNNANDAITDLAEKWIKVTIAGKQDNVEIIITDSGKGISNGVRKKIFQPFYTTKDIGKGTGLGLSVAKGIIESHNGKLYYEENSKNTQFVISLPKMQRASCSQVARTAA